MFDVRLNGHVVVKDLDIFDRVGHSTAHDEIVPFSIRRGKLSVQGEVSTFNGKLTVEFVKVGILPGFIFADKVRLLLLQGRSSSNVISAFQGYYDNPKVCALYVMKGTLEGENMSAAGQSRVFPELPRSAAVLNTPGRPLLLLYVIEMEF